jgi:hypothetical protein
MFLAFLKSLKKGNDPDPFVRGTDPRIRIRTKMLRTLHCPNLTFIAISAAHTILGAYHLFHLCTEGSGHIDGPLIGPVLLRPLTAQGKLWFILGKREEE